MYVRVWSPTHPKYCAHSSFAPQDYSTSSNFIPFVCRREKTMNQEVQTLESIWAIKTRIFWILKCRFIAPIAFLTHLVLRDLLGSRKVIRTYSLRGISCSNHVTSYFTKYIAIAPACFLACLAFKDINNITKRPCHFLRSYPLLDDLIALLIA